MAAVLAGTAFAALLAIIYAAWRRYLWAAEQGPDQKPDPCPYSLTDRFGQNALVNVPHQEGIHGSQRYSAAPLRDTPNLRPCRFPTPESH